MKASTLACTIITSLMLVPGPGEAQPHIDFQKQGYAARLQLNNLGAFGHVAYPPFNPGSPGDAPAESLGLEYPLGRLIEHIWGAGLWIGGLLDTSASGNGQNPRRLVSVTYEGWAGPYYEFYPGSGPADTFWAATRHDPSPPPGWDDYWQGSLPFAPRSDQDYYCTYTDTAVGVAGHVPMWLKVVQSSYAWDDTADFPLIVLEYRVMNMGLRTLDSVYVGFFLDADVGHIQEWGYHIRNFSGYDQDLHLGYTHHPHYPSSTPVGLRLLACPSSCDSLGITFQWFAEGAMPADDATKYAMLSSGLVIRDEYPALSDTRFVLAVGPFTLHPSGTQTLRLAVAVVSGRNITDMKLNAERALVLYQGGSTPETTPIPGGMPAQGGSRSQRNEEGAGRIGP